MNFLSRHSLRLGTLSLLLLPLGSAVNRPQQGPQPDPQVIAQFGLYQNATLQSLIDTKGQQMNKISDRPGNYGFTIVDSPIINAFATPDGHVYFTRGIMAYFNNEAQFAGVLGHELGHITARHGQQQQRRSTVASVLLGLGSLASKRVASIAQPLSQGVGVLFLKYGRDDEREADQLGVKYSTKIGYDAAQMADFFNTLQRTEAQSGAGSTPTFLSSHPNSADRYKTVKALAAQTKASLGNVTLNVNRDQYLRAIEGLPYGDDPRQGFVENSTFYHPDLKFQLPIPTGWKSQNSTTQFQMAEPGGKALMVLLPAPGTSLEAAAQALSKSIGLSSAQAQQTTINGFPAIVFQGDQAAQSGSASARVLAYTLQDGGNYYGIVGLSTPANFATYSPQFTRVAQGFQRLTDAGKLGRQPEKVHIKTASGSQTLAQALSANGIAASRQEEMAILNGMQRADRLSAGQLFKVVSR